MSLPPDQTAGADYACARDIAWTGEESERAALAAGRTAPEILYYLAADPAPSVREAVARNASTPPQADHLLARDAAPAVRATLGRKLAALAPGLSGAEQDRLQRRSWESLCALAADRAAEVRAAIAEVLREMPEAPRALILQLAQDAEMCVAEPVIRLSPLLTEADLLALVQVPPVPETVIAVARRPRLSEAVSDAIIARAEAGTVAILLENESAAIRESALDALIANAANHDDWLRPLVRRPRLSAAVARKLGEIVTDQWLDLLAARADLAPEVTAELRARVSARLAPAEMQESGLGAETRFRLAAAQGDRDAMTALLATASGVPETAVRRAVRLRSAKALVSLCWRAGFAPAAIEPAQVALGQIAPRTCLPAGPDGSWPLARDEMNWQLELLES